MGHPPQRQHAQLGDPARPERHSPGAIVVPERGAAGHTLAGDNFINLRDALDSGTISPGDRLLLFAYGFGAHWTSLAVEA